jgi:hypothetical protein
VSRSDLKNSRAACSMAIRQIINAFVVKNL